MEHLFERIAYLKGLTEGLDVAKSSKEGKVLSEIVNVLDEFADAIVELDENQEELNDFVETIDEDLEHLENEFYPEDIMLEDESCESGCCCDEEEIEE